MVYAIFALSGAAGLGYELVWTRLFAVGVGHEVAGVLAVVAAYFGGLALGAWLLDRPVSHSRRPGHWYAGCELLIGLWGLLAAFLIPLANGWIALWTGPRPSPAWQWLMAFVVPAIVLLPATMAMGATLPAIDRFVTRLRGGGRSVGGLYAANTFGAVVGTLAVTFGLIPTLGLRQTSLVLVAASLVCAAGLRFGPWPPALPIEPSVSAPTAGLSRQRLYMTVLLTGLLGLGYEVVAVRVMGQVLENTAYTFASLLAVYLLGTAAGAAVYQRVTRRRQPGDPLGYLLAGLAASIVIGGLIMLASRGIYEGVRQAAAARLTGSIAGELLLAALVFLIPSGLMGATFSHLAQSLRRSDRGVGCALAVNTVGAALAPALFGVVLIPLIGSKWALIVLAAGYLLLIPGFRQLRLALVAIARWGWFSSCLAIWRWLRCRLTDDWLRFARG